MLRRSQGVRTRYADLARGFLGASEALLLAVGFVTGACLAACLGAALSWAAVSCTRLPGQVPAQDA